MDLQHLSAMQRKVVAVRGPGVGHDLGEGDPQGWVLAQHL